MTYLYNIENASEYMNKQKKIKVLKNLIKTASDMMKKPDITDSAFLRWNNIHSVAWCAWYKTAKELR